MKVIVRKRNQITLPNQLNVIEGTEFEITQQGDGSLLLEPCVSIPASQQYFWTKRWQEGEAEARNDLRTGHVKRFKSAKDAIASLHKKG